MNVPLCQVDIKQVKDVRVSYGECQAWSPSLLMPQTPPREDECCSVRQLEKLKWKQGKYLSALYTGFRISICDGSFLYCFCLPF